jgi:hypothetical protein
LNELLSTGFFVKGSSMKPLLFAALGCAMLIGCDSAPGVWMRTDGQSTKGDPVLTKQFETDRTACIGQRQQAGLSGATAQAGGAGGTLQSMRSSDATDIVRQCMAQKGYMLVPKSEVEDRGEAARAATTTY